MITNAGLNYLGSHNHDNLAMCRIGTGNTAEATTDTALGSQVGYTTTAGVGEGFGVNATDNYVWRKTSHRFAAGTISGVNLAEVGWAASNSVSLFSRSLIRGSDGMPTTITLDTDEVLDVQQELRAYISPSDITSTETIDGTSVTVTLRQFVYVGTNGANFAKYLGVGFSISLYTDNQSTITCLENQPAVGVDPGWPAVRANYSVNTYIADSHTVTVTVNADLGSFNYPTGIGAVTFSDRLNWFTTRVWLPFSVGFSPKLNKTSARTGSVTCGLSWGRYTP